MRCSGIPHRPNPETITAAPSGTSRTASAALFTTLSMGFSPGRGPEADDSRGRLSDPSRGRRARRVKDPSWSRFHAVKRYHSDFVNADLAGGAGDGVGDGFGDAFGDGAGDGAVDAADAPGGGGVENTRPSLVARISDLSSTSRAVRTAVATSPPWKVDEAPAHSRFNDSSSARAAARPASSMPWGSLCESVSQAIRVAIVSCRRGTPSAR